MQTNLGKVITEIQRDAAGTSTPDLRADIEVGLEVLDAAITDLHALRPGADVMERIIATSDFMETVITIALYVRELATRPVDQLAAGRHQPQLAVQCRARRRPSSSGPAQRDQKGALFRPAPRVHSSPLIKEAT